MEIFRWMQMKNLPFVPLFATHHTLQHTKWKFLNVSAKCVHITCEKCTKETFNCWSCFSQKHVHIHYTLKVSYMGLNSNLQFWFICQRLSWNSDPHSNHLETLPYTYPYMCEREKLLSHASWIIINYRNYQTTKRNEKKFLFCGNSL